jgi:hypothetical protein
MDGKQTVRLDKRSGISQPLTMEHHPLFGTRGKALAVGLLIGPSFMAFFHLTFLMISGQWGKNANFPTFVGQAFVFSFPYVVLAVRQGARRVWLLAGAISALIYGYYLFDEIRCTLEYGRTASPLVKKLMVLGIPGNIALAFLGTRAARRRLTA